MAEIGGQWTRFRGRPGRVQALAWALVFPSLSGFYACTTATAEGSVSTTTEPAVVATTTTTTLAPPTTVAVAVPLPASAVVSEPPWPPAPGCTPGYSPCIPPGDDVDCAGGSGDGPRSVSGPLAVDPSAGDPYGLDGDNDRIGCES
jgi:hypothetical protein